MKSFEVSATLVGLPGPPGPQGPPGPDGPPGSSSSVYEYSYSTGAIPPGSANITLEQGPPTILNIDYSPLGTTGSYAPLLRNITVADEVTLQNKTDETQYLTGVVSDVVDHALDNYIAVTVADVTGSLTLSNQQKVLLFHSIVGAPGPGVPAGGTTGQVLVKASDADFDTQWVDPA